MNEKSFEFLLPIIDHIARCTPQERKRVLREIGFIGTYFKELQSASHRLNYNSLLERKAIKAGTDDSSSSFSSAHSTRLKDCMLFLHERLISSKSIFPPQVDLLALSRQLITPTWDNYDRGFKEISVLGSGSYGVVVKAKHLLDDKHYAIKKIPLRSLSRQDHADVVKEVLILSKLYHKNIAMYHSSWVQMYIFDSQLTIQEDESDQKHFWRKFSESESNADDTSSGGIVFEDSSSKSVDRYQSQTSLVSASASNASDSLALTPANCASSLPPSMPIPTLFIQMQLGGRNLRRWLDQRNEKHIEGKFAWTKSEQRKHFNIFHNLLSALEFIHSKKIIHLDIKPANIIFARERKEVMLGDFGLAQRFNQRNFDASKLGTFTYAAPETAQSRYDWKSDIYSLGIVLLELLQPFGSMSERADVIRSLKEKRLLDQKFKNDWPHCAELVLLMTNCDPQKRPSASDILKMLSEPSQLTLLHSDHLISTTRSSLNKNPFWIRRSHSDKNIKARSLKRFSSLQPPKKGHTSSFSRSYNSGFFRFKPNSSCHQMRKHSKKRKCKMCHSKDIEIKTLRSKIETLERQIQSLTMNQEKPDIL